MSSRSFGRLARSRLGLTTAALTLMGLLFSGAAHGVLNPVTAICFKALGDSGVCQCATGRLGKKIAEEALDQYENLIARALSQNNVPRNQAWQHALKLEAKAAGTPMSRFKSETEETGRAHTLAVRSCNKNKPRRQTTRKPK